MTAGVAAKYDARIADGLVPARRWGEPSDVGAAVAALAARRLGFSTGCVINVDGGLGIPQAVRPAVSMSRTTSSWAPGRQAACWPTG